MKVWKFLIILAITTSCSFTKRQEVVVSNNDVDEIYHYLIDTFLIQRASYFTICGNYFSDFNDSILSEKLRKFKGPLLKEKDINIMVHYYNKSKGMELSKNVDVSKYIVIKELDKYTDRKFYAIHFELSPPMFTQGQDTCVVYIHANYYKKGQTGAFIAFVRDKDFWTHPYLIVDKNVLQFEGYHHHDYSLIDSTFFYTD